MLLPYKILTIYRHIFYLMANKTFSWLSMIKDWDKGLTVKAALSTRSRLPTKSDSIQVLFNATWVQIHQYVKPWN